MSMARVNGPKSESSTLKNIYILTFKTYFDLSISHII
jgi:hypothetical protein